MNYIIITFGYLWDLIFSEPKKIPHLVVLIGSLISLFEKKLFKEENTNKNKNLKGMLLNFLVLLIVFYRFFNCIFRFFNSSLYLYINFRNFDFFYNFYRSFKKSSYGNI